MEDSNQQTQQAPSQNPTLQNIQRNEPKTFLQQFNEVAQKVQNHDALFGQAEQGFAIIGGALKGMGDEQMLINDQLQAIMILSEEGSKITRENVANKIQELRVSEAKNRLSKDEASGLIRKTEYVKDLNSIVVFNDDSKNLMYAYHPAGSFKEEEVLSNILGKKAGDVLGNVKIIDVYEIVEENAQGNQ